MLQNYRGYPRPIYNMKGNGIFSGLLKLKQEFPGERHLPLRQNGRWVMAQYCGPGTHVETRIKRGDKGINKVDQACKEHDIAYKTLSFAPVSQQRRHELSREADNKLEKAAKKEGGWNGLIISKGMQLKKFGEDKIGLSKSRYFT